MLNSLKLLPLSILLVALVGCGQAPVEPELTSAPVAPEPAIECNSDETSVTLAGFEYRETVEDEYGCYVRIQLDSSNPILALDREKFPLENLASSGLSESEVNESYVLALNFFVNETLDNVGLDNRNAAREWFNAEEVQKFFSSESVKTIEETLSEASLESLGLVLANRLPEPGLREDIPRQGSVELEVVDVAIIETNSEGSSVEPYVQVTVQGQIVVAFEDEPFSQWVLRNNSSVTEAQLRETNPELFDGESNNLILLTVESILALSDGVIVGSSLYYETEIASGIDAS